METMRATLSAWAEMVELCLNGFSLLCILAGVILSLVTSFEHRRKAPGDHPLHTYFRKTFGGWLIVALEFQLAADIVATLFVPSKAHLIELGAIAVIRTFLNYFLNKELHEEKENTRLVSEQTKGSK